jgi:hypothetical protein
VRDSVLRLTQFHRAACTLPEQDTDLSITLRDFMAALRGTGSDLTICRAGLLLAGTAESRRPRSPPHEPKPAHGDRSGSVCELEREGGVPLCHVRLVVWIG